MATFSVSTKFTAIDGMSAVFAKMNGGIGKLETSLNGFEKRVGSSLGKLGQFGLALGGTAVMTNMITATIDLDKNLKSLSAITGVTGKGFDDFKSRINALSATTGMFKGDVAKAMEVVGNAAPEFLKNADALSAVTEASITLSKASGDDLYNSALSLTGVMNQFGLSAKEAVIVMNTLAAGSQVGSAGITLVNEALKNFGAVAAGSNMSVETSVALIEVLAKKSIVGAEAGTKLRGATIKLKEAGLGYASGLFNINDALGEAKKKYDKLSTAKEKDAFLTKTFGIENITSGTILLENIGLLNEYTKGVTGTSTALDQATINSSSLANMIKLLGDKFKNFVTSTDESSVALSIMRNTLGFLYNNLNGILTTIGIAIGVYGGLKVAIWATRAATLAQSIALGVQNGLMQRSLFFISENKIALAADAIVTKTLTGLKWLQNTAITALTFIIGQENVAKLTNSATTKGLALATKWSTFWTNSSGKATKALTGLTWLLNVSGLTTTGTFISNSLAKVWNTTCSWLAVAGNIALTASIWICNVALGAMMLILSPTVIIILAIVAAIVAILAVIAYWGDITAWFGKVWSSTINYISDAWNNLISWFTNFDFVNFFKEIGNSIIQFMLWPIKKILELVSTFPGKIGETAKSAMKTLDGMQMSVNAKAEKPLNAEATVQKNNQQNNSSLDVNIKTQQGTTATIEKKTGSQPVKVTNNI